MKLLAVLAEGQLHLLIYGIECSFEQVILTEKDYSNPNAHQMH